ncbi:MAG TPA: HD domain-containing protein, partial [Mycobacteriales bacterium]
DSGDTASADAASGNAASAGSAWEADADSAVARVLLLKLADRLHNMRTARFLPVAKRRQKSAETLQVFAPLARRLGLGKTGRELEEIAAATLRAAAATAPAAPAPKKAAAKKAPPASPAKTAKATKTAKAAKTAKAPTRKAAPRKRTAEATGAAGPRSES